MKSLSLTFAVKDIADRAGDITAVLGASRANEEGNVLFERLALTGDDYLVVCHAVVEAATEIENRCMGYMPEVCLAEGDGLGLVAGGEFCVCGA